ncbi:MBL fold metallo-hydrolase, partial [bacterium]|nr:MBL fold metallo-hydrolase [bacterium]
EFRIGDFEAWSISHGYGTFKQGVTKKMWPPAEQAEMTKALVALGERPDDMTLYVNILLLRHGKEVIIVDAGFGPHTNTNWGWLADAMESIGIAFGDVTHALLSHSHIDHIGGLASGGKILF